MKTRRIVCALMLAGAAAGARANCDPYVRQSPGGDYTNPEDRQGLAIVEQFHFTPNVEHLVRGESAALGGDIDYTLRHFPNHHRALAAMAKLARRDKSAKPNGATYPVACYFERAIGFRPDDAIVRMIYGSYLLSAKQDEAALFQLREAARFSPENGTIHYNLGLLYAKKKDYAQANEHAGKAYELGFPLPGLRNKLVAAGQWRPSPARDKPEPEAAAGPAAADAPVK